MNKLNMVEKKLNQSNLLLAEVLKRNGISRLRLTSGVNSIASGYSATRTIMPLLYRNKNLESIMSKNGIALERHHFSRPQNNCCEHFYDWLTLNTKESSWERSHSVILALQREGETCLSVISIFS